jgi:citrate synthase
MNDKGKKSIEYGATVAGTAIAASSRDAIYIRDRSLVEDLMGKIDFTSMIVFQMRGHMPEEPERHMIDAILVMLMEHGLTPSSISARLIYDSSPDALQGAVAGGLLAAGSVFLGAMEHMSSLLQRGVAAIERGESTAAEYSRDSINAILEQGATVPGFGHHIHRPDDPRTPRLLALAAEQGVAGPHAELLWSFGEAMDEIKGRHVTINATGAVAAVLSDLGYPPAIMRGFSLIARAAGLVGHLLEEQQEPLAREMWDLLEHSVPYQGTALDSPENTREDGTR